MGIVEKIKDICSEKDIAVSELERKVGLANGTIRRWDNAAPNITNLTKVADYLDISIDYLMGRDQASLGIDPETLRIAREIKPLNKAQKDAIAGIVKTYID